MGDGRWDSCKASHEKKKLVFGEERSDRGAMTMVVVVVVVVWFSTSVGRGLETSNLPAFDIFERDEACSRAAGASSRTALVK
jgi:hypothetical protein